MDQPTQNRAGTNASGNWYMIEGYPHQVMRWTRAGERSEFFSVEAVLQTLIPEFTLNGGGPDLIQRWNANKISQQEMELIKLLLPRTLPQRVRDATGDSAPDYNNGPSWIQDPANPAILLAWDGDSFSGEKELLSVVRQRISDAESGVNETVAHIAPPTNGEPGWWIDPERPTDLIHFGGLRWDRRKSVRQTLEELFTALGEEVPEQWKGEQVGEPRQLELVKQLNARANGIDGWYKSVHRFDDPVMRYWERGAWTEHYSSHPAAWLDDPWDDSYTRYWDGQQWTKNVKSKESERIRAEKAQRRREFAAEMVTTFVDSYTEQSTPEARRRRAIDAANERSRRLRDAAAIEQEQFYRDRQIPWYRRR